MGSLTICINGQEVQAEEGSTVLEAAKAAGVDIPTLCHHPALENWGGCRMCLVEVEPRGLLHSACTFPVSPGLRLQTHSEKVVRARQYVLQWLFSERSHYCMYCPSSGECDLQSQAYKHGLEHWTWNAPNKRLPLDASRQHFIYDHSRCILCRRCVRACGEISAVHTLGMGQRGAKTTVVADLNAPFNSSTCISCGTCLQVCPTGALIDRRSAYMGRTDQLEATKSTCAGCSIGCGIVGRTRNNQLLRIEGDWDAPVNGGLLCRLGRFEPLYVTAQRVTAPMRKVGGQLQPCSWEEALAAIASRANGSTSLLVSSRATNEEMDAAKEAGAAAVALYGGAACQAAPGQAANLSDIPRAKAIVGIEADLDGEHEVAACFARRALDNGARLYLLGGQADKLALLARLSGDASRVGEVAAEVAAAGDAVVLYGPAAKAETLASFADVPGVRFLGLPAGANTAAAVARDLAQSDGGRCGLLYVYAADDAQASTPEAKADFLVAHACYRSALTEAADVVLPSLHWSEKEGHLTNLEGKVQALHRLVEPAAGLRDDRDVLAAALGASQSGGCDGEA